MRGADTHHYSKGTTAGFVFGSFRAPRTRELSTSTVQIMDKAFLSSADSIRDQHEVGPDIFLEVTT